MESKTYSIKNRRLRSSSHVRELASSVQLSARDFIQPIFVDESLNDPHTINSLTGVNADTIDSALKQMEADLENGVSKFLLFPIPARKSESSLNCDFVLRALQAIRVAFGHEVWVAADVCLCAYTSHGHCGILNKERTRILNSETVKVLADYALALADAGADCIAPSDMMDGRISAIRKKLDDNQLDDVTIMSYSAKFSSQFYGPFRDACKSSPDGSILKDRKTYQLSPLNSKDALFSSLRDVEEGADIVMVKPSLPYLDIIYQLNQKIRQPVAAYHVSGEYQALELLASQGLVNRAEAHAEVWTALKRAGAQIVISYAARHANNWINHFSY